MLAENINLDFVTWLLGLVFFILLPLCLWQIDLDRLQRRSEKERQQDRDELLQLNVLKKGLEEKNNQLQENVNAVEEKLKSAKQYKDRISDLRDRIKLMERIWLDPKSSEEDCETVLFDNHWVLWPDYDVRQGFHRQKQVNTAISKLFPEQAIRSAGFNNLGQTKDLKMDLVGWAYTEANFENHLVDKNNKVLLLIELKAPNILANQAALQQAYAYATDMMAKASSELWGKRIDCLLIAGKVKNDISDAYIRLGPDATQTVRIVPLSYQTLINRAKVMIESFVPRA